MKFISWRVC